MLLPLVINDFVKIRKFKSFVYLLLFIILILLLWSFAIGTENGLNQILKNSSGHNGYISFFLGQYFFLSMFGLIFINLTSSFLILIEEKHKTWKYLYSLPVPIHLYLISKIISSILINLSLIIFLGVAICIHALLLPISVKSIPFFDYTSSLSYIVLLLSKFFILSLVVSAIHVTLSFYLRHQTILLLASVFLPIICLYSFLKNLPYGWPMENFWIAFQKMSNNERLSLMGEYEWYSLSLFTLILIILVCAKTERLQLKRDEI